MGFEFRLPEGLVPVCFEGIGSKKKLVQRGPAWFEDEKGKENERRERGEGGNGAITSITNIS